MNITVYSSVILKIKERSDVTVLKKKIDFAV